MKEYQELAKQLRDMERTGDLIGWRETVLKAAAAIEHLAAEVQSLYEDAAGESL